MAKTILNGYYIAPPTTLTLHSNAGRLYAVLVSHAQTTVQTVIFYDNTAASGTMILRINIQPNTSPFFLQLPRQLGIPFSTGLHVDPGSCDVNVWSLDNG